MIDDHGRWHRQDGGPNYYMIRVPGYQRELPVMTHRRTSQFILIKRAAELEGWGVLYMDYGVGHDSHVFTHKKKRQVLEVFYRSGRPTAAHWNGEEVPVHQIIDVLTGVETPKPQKRGA